MTFNNRVLKLEGANNFRDIGGLITRNGGLMKQGVFYRSDSLHKVTKNDAYKIEELHIKLICDLRMPNERKGKIDKISNRSKMRVESIPIYPMPLRQDPGAFARIKMLLMGKYKNFDYKTFMKGCYLRFALEHACEIRSIINLLADEHNAPAIIHCTAGKDRTGWISALLQSLADVPKEVLFEDYLLSNTFLFENKGKLDSYVKVYSFFQMDRKSIQQMMEVRGEYLENAFAAVLGKHATIEDYLIQSCGIKRETVLRIKKFLLD